jgi:hypothetical protein
MESLIAHKVEDQFVHTQFALVDRYGRVRAIYDGLKRGDTSRSLISKGCSGKK